MPPPAPRSRDPPSAAANPTIEANIEPTAESSERIEGMDEWKSTYEGYLSQWRADSAEARKKAVEARKRIEDEREVERRAALDESTVQRKAREAEEREKERKERLRRELEDRTTVEKGGGAGERGDERVKEAWEMMKGGSEDSERKEVVTDARGVMDHDVAAGQASISNKGRPSVKQVNRLTFPSLTSYLTDWI
jgi:hypothetical protein